MNSPHSDSLVFFGATGDLAYKKVIPALKAVHFWSPFELPCSFQGFRGQGKYPSDDG